MDQIARFTIQYTGLVLSEPERHKKACLFSVQYEIRFVLYNTEPTRTMHAGFHKPTFD
jgi:hypothetical protein